MRDTNCIITSCLCAAVLFTGCSNLHWSTPEPTAKQSKPTPIRSAAGRSDQRPSVQATQATSPAASTQARLSNAPTGSPRQQSTAAAQVDRPSPDSPSRSITPTSRPATAASRLPDPQQIEQAAKHVPPEMQAYYLRSLQALAEVDEPRSQKPNQGTAATTPLSAGEVAQPPEPHVVRPPRQLADTSAGKTAHAAASSLPASPSSPPASTGVATASYAAAERLPDAPDAVNSTRQAAEPNVNGAEPADGPVTASTGDEPPLPDDASQADLQPPEPDPIVWQDALHNAIVALQQELEKRPGPKDEEQVRLEASLRMMYLLAGRHADSLHPIEDLDLAEQEFWKHLLHALAVRLARQGHPLNARRHKELVRHLQTAVDNLSSISNLDVSNLAFCSKVESFGRYTEFESYEFTPNQEVLLYVEVANFAVLPKGDMFETELQGSYQIVDQSGRRVTDQDFLRDKQLCRNRRRDYFIPYHLYMPKDIPPGKYTLFLTMEDIKGEKFGQSSIDFQIKQ